MKKSKSINIMFITSGLGFAGAEKMLTYVANQLSLRNYKCSIFNLNKTDEYVNEKKQKINDSINVYTLNNKVENNFKIVAEIYKAARKEKVNVLVGFTTFPNMYAKIVGILLGAVSIMSERGDPSRTANIHTIKDKIAFNLINRCSGGVFQTEGAKNFYGEKLQHRGIIIPNPIYLEDNIVSLPYEAHEHTVVSVGRLDNEQKRYDIMLDAFKKFHCKHSEYILKIYGTGSDEGLIKQWVIDKQLSEYVEFMGVSFNPMKDISNAGMFLITSDYEGISNSLLEAMALGLPCVSTDHEPGGARLLIQNRSNGLLAPIGDSEKLSIAMCEFAEDKILAKNCGENAKNVITRFDPNHIIDLWEEYIKEIVNKRMAGKIYAW